MTSEFKLPDVGEGLDEAEIVEWLVAVGDDVRRDQPLVEILTDKSQTQLPSPVAGTVTSLGFAEGDMAHVGQVLVTIDGPDAALNSVEHKADPGAVTAPTATATAPRREPAARSPRPKASPAIRRKALEAGIDLGSIVGSGPGGRIVEADLAARVERPQRDGNESPKPLDNLGSLGQMSPGHHRLRGIRRVTATAMQRSWEIPRIHGNDELDATNLLSGRQQIRELHADRASNLTPVAFFVMAVAGALRRYPMLNASIDIDAGEIVVHEHVNIGIAVASEAGLVVPVINDADRLGLFEVADEISRLSAAARDRSITAAQMSGGTCTITNYGSLGGRDASPLIRAPEVAIVGFGAIRKRPFVVDDSVVARPTLPIVTAVDHRLIDGDLMTAFQQHIMVVLTEPVALMVR